MSWDGYLLMVWSPAGYTLREMEGTPPHPGQEFEDAGRILEINKVGVSPFPGDNRACAFSVGKS